MAIPDWMPTLATYMAQIEGLAQVHTYVNLPGTLSVFPSMIILPVSGDQMVGGPNISHHRVQATLYVASQILPEGYKTAVPFIKRTLTVLVAHIKLGGVVDHCYPAPPPENWYSGPGEISYGDKKHLGIIFRLDVKEHETLTITP